MRLRSILLPIGLFAASVAAHADTISFSLVGNGFSAQGTFDATSEGAGKYLVTGITTVPVDGAISLLPVNGFVANDNLLFFGTNQLVDFGGLSFLVNGVEGNLFSTGPNQYRICLTTGCTGSVNDGGPVSFSAQLATTPEPSSLALLGTGIAGIATVVRRRRLV